MIEFTEVLEHIGKRSGMWFGPVGYRSFSHLQVFITGYQHGHESGSGGTQILFHFLDWVRLHYGVIDGKLNSWQLISHHIGGDDQLAFDEFFRLWAIYLRGRGESD